MCIPMVETYVVLLRERHASCRALQIVYALMHDPEVPCKLASHLCIACIISPLKHHTKLP